MAIFREDRDPEASIRKMAEDLTDNPHVLEGAEDELKRAMDRYWSPLEEASTKAGPHRPDKGTEYDEFKQDDEECCDKCDHNTPCCEKDKPEDGKDPEVCPGDGPDLGKKPAQDKPEKFKEHGKNLKKKDKPGKETDNRTEKDGKAYPKTKKMTLGDSLEQAVDKAIVEGYAHLDPEIVAEIKAEGAARFTDERELCEFLGVEHDFELYSFLPMNKINEAARQLGLQVEEHGRNEYYVQEIFSQDYPYA